MPAVGNERITTKLLMTLLVSLICFSLLLVLEVASNFGSIAHHIYFQDRQEIAVLKLGTLFTIGFVGVCCILLQGCNVDIND